MANDGTSGVFNTTLPTLSNGAQSRLQVDAAGRLIVSSGDENVTLTKSSVTCSGASASLVGASTTRTVVIISNAEANSSAAVDPTGGTCALDAGVALPAGTTIAFTGKAAQSGMTQFGTTGHKLTVYVG